MDAHAGLSHQFKIIFQFMVGEHTCMTVGQILFVMQVHLAVHPQVERAKFMEETLKSAFLIFGLVKSINVVQ